MFLHIFFNENIYLSASYIFLKLNGSNKTKMHGEWRQSFGNINEDIDLCEVKVNDMAWTHAWWASSQNHHDGHHGCMGN
jgi:hypothetical protein